MTIATIIERLSLLQSTFLWQGLLAALVTGLLCGLMSPIFTWRRLGFLGDAVAHSSLAPASIAIWLGLPVQIFIFPFAILLGGGLAKFEERGKAETDSLIAVFFAGLLALGVLILSATGKGSSEIVHFLLGNILLVNLTDVLVIGLCALAAMIFLYYRRHAILLALLHPDLAATEGIQVHRLNMQLLIFCSLVVVVCLKIVGIVLMTSLLTAPSLIANRFAKSVTSHVIASTILGVFVAGTGYILSIVFDLPSGACIAVFSLLLFQGAAYLFRPVYRTVKAE